MNNYKFNSSIIIIIKRLCPEPKDQKEKYKTVADQTRTSKRIGRIRCHGKVSILLTGHTQRVLFVVIGKNEKKIRRQ